MPYSILWQAYGKFMAFEPSRNLHTVAINLPEIYIRMAILWQIAISVMAIAITVMAICHTIRTEICHKIVIVAINLLEIYIRIGTLPYGL